MTTHDHNAADANEKQIAHANEIWGRARANAFAHRAAAERYECISSVLFFVQLILGLVSLFLVIILYAIIAGDPEIGTGKTPLLLTIASVVYSMIGLAIGVMQNYYAFEERQISHNHNQHSYLYIAQRAREIHFPGLSLERASALLEDLERDFQILKVRGQEPSDREFRIGHVVLDRIQRSKFGKLQSGNIDQADKLLADKTSDSKNEDNVAWRERHACLIIILVFSILLLSSGSLTLYFGIEYYAEDKQVVATEGLSVEPDNLIQFP